MMLKVTFIAILAILGLTAQGAPPVYNGGVDASTSPKRLIVQPLNRECRPPEYYFTGTVIPGVTDESDFFYAASNACQAAGGGVVPISVGCHLLAGGIATSPGLPPVIFRGAMPGPFSAHGPPCSPALYPTIVATATNASLFGFYAFGDGIENVAIWYPNQPSPVYCPGGVGTCPIVAANCTPSQSPCPIHYPATIQCSQERQHVKGVSIYNAWIGIQIFLGQCNVSDTSIGAFNTGVWDRLDGIGTLLDNVGVGAASWDALTSPQAQAPSNIDVYAGANATGFLIQRSDAARYTRLFCYQLSVCWYFFYDGTPSDASYGQGDMWQCDQCNIGIQMDTARQGLGWSVSNLSLGAGSNGSSAHPIVMTTPNPPNYPLLHVNGGFLWSWSSPTAYSQIVVPAGGGARLYLANWDPINPLGPLVNSASAGASPWVFTNSYFVPVSLYLNPNGATVSQVQYRSVNYGNSLLDPLTPVIRVGPWDSLVVTYTVATPKYTVIGD